MDLLFSQNLTEHTNKNKSRRALNDCEHNSSNNKAEEFEKVRSQPLNWSSYLYMYQCIDHCLSSNFLYVDSISGMC